MTLATDLPARTMEHRCRISHERAIGSIKVLTIRTSLYLLLTIGTSVPHGRTVNPVAILPHRRALSGAGVLFNPPCRELAAVVFFWPLFFVLEAT